MSNAVNKDPREQPCKDCVARHLACHPIPGEKCTDCKSWSRECSHMTQTAVTAPTRSQPPLLQHPPSLPPLPPPPTMPPSPLPQNSSVKSSLSSCIPTGTSTSSSTTAPAPTPTNEIEVSQKCAMCTLYKKKCMVKKLGEQCTPCVTAGMGCSFVCCRCRQLKIKCVAKKDEPCKQCIAKKRNCSLPRPECKQCTERNASIPPPLQRVRCHSDKWGVACNPCKQKGSLAACSLDKDPISLARARTQASALSQVFGSTVRTTMSPNEASTASSSQISATKLIPASSSATSTPTPLTSTAASSVTRLSFFLPREPIARIQTAATPRPVPTNGILTTLKHYITPTTTPSALASATKTTSTSTPTLASSSAPATRLSSLASISQASSSSDPTPTSTRTTTPSTTTTTAAKARAKSRLRVDTSAAVSDLDSPLSDLTSLDSRSPSPMMLEDTPPTSAGSPGVGSGLSMPGASASTSQGPTAAPNGATPATAGPTSISALAVGAKRKRPGEDEGPRRPAPTPRPMQSDEDDDIIDLTRSPSPEPRRVGRPSVAAVAQRSVPRAAQGTSIVVRPVQVRTATVSGRAQLIRPQAGSTRGVAGLSRSSSTSSSTSASTSAPGSAPAPAPAPTPPASTPTLSTTDISLLARELSSQISSQVLSQTQDAFSAMSTRLDTFSSRLDTLERGVESALRSNGVQLAEFGREGRVQMESIEARFETHQLEIKNMCEKVVEQGETVRVQVDGCFEAQQEQMKREIERSFGLFEARLMGGIGRWVQDKWGVLEETVGVAVKKGIEEVGDRVTKDVRERVAEDVGERVAREVGERVAQDVGERVAKDVGERVAREVGERVSKEVGDVMAQEREREERRAAKRPRLDNNAEGSENASMSVEAGPSVTTTTHAFPPRSLESLALERIDEHSAQQTAYLQDQFGEFVGRCEDTTAQLWHRSSAVLKNLTKLQNTTLERLKAGVKTSVGTEVARLNREFGRLEGLAMRRIDDKIVAGQMQLGGVGVHDGKKAEEEGAKTAYTVSEKVSDRVEGLQQEIEVDDPAGYQLREAVF